MLILYNTLQILILILFFPLILIYAAAKSKYRSHIPRRLGLGLKKEASGLSKKGKTVWIHALSVGEVTSAQLLVAELRENEKNLTIVFSASTSSGYSLAVRRLSRHCDLIIAYPLDIFPIVSYFVNTLRPDLFILVETDFWPNIISTLKRRGVPLILVNGRVSQKSFELYKRCSFFFAPMFQSFKHLCVQSDEDKLRLIQVGVENTRISKLGNLKYEQIKPSNSHAAARELHNCKGRILVAGSTHKGEEQIIFEACARVMQKHKIVLVLAPRNISRAGEISVLAKKYNFIAQRHTEEKPFSGDVYILDTIGDLTSFYTQSHICFIGGSLIDEGGHNPLEAANLGKPILFGPYMSDFHEIADDLLQTGGGLQVSNASEFTDMVTKLIEEPEFYELCSRSALDSTRKMQGTLLNHLDLLRKFL